MKAEEATAIAKEAQTSFEFEYRAFMSYVEHYAKLGRMCMPIKRNSQVGAISNKLIDRLISEGYTLTQDTIYWSTKES